MTKFARLVVASLPALVASSTVADIPCSTEDICNRHIMALLPGTGSYRALQHHTAGLQTPVVKCERLKDEFSGYSKCRLASFYDTGTRTTHAVSGRDRYTAFYRMRGGTAKIDNVDLHHCSDDVYGGGCRLVKTYDAATVAEWERNSSSARGQFAAQDRAKFAAATAEGSVPCATQHICNRQLMAILPGTGNYRPNPHESPTTEGGRKRRLGPDTPYWRAGFTDAGTRLTREENDLDYYIVFYAKHGDTASIAQVELRRKGRQIRTYDAATVAQWVRNTATARGQLPSQVGEETAPMPTAAPADGKPNVDCDSMADLGKRIACRMAQDAVKGLEGWKK